MHSLYTQPGSRLNSRFRFQVLIKLFRLNFFKKKSKPHCFSEKIKIVKKQKSIECN
jgi:hypothetical protein